MTIQVEIKHKNSHDQKVAVRTVANMYNTKKEVCGQHVSQPHILAAGESIILAVWKDSWIEVKEFEE